MQVKIGLHAIIKIHIQVSSKLAENLQNVIHNTLKVHYSQNVKYHNRK